MTKFATISVSMPPDVANRLRFYQLAMGVSMSSLVQIACTKLIDELPPIDDVAEVARKNVVPYMGATRSVEVAADRIATLKQGALELK